MLLQTMVVLILDNDVQTGCRMRSRHQSRNTRTCGCSTARPKCSASRATSKSFKRSPTCTPGLDVSKERLYTKSNRSGHWHKRLAIRVPDGSVVHIGLEAADLLVLANPRGQQCVQVRWGLLLQSSR